MYVSVCVNTMNGEMKNKTYIRVYLLHFFECKAQSKHSITRLLQALCNIRICSYFSALVQQAFCHVHDSRNVGRAKQTVRIVPVFCLISASRAAAPAETGVALGEREPLLYCHACSILSKVGLGV